MLKASEYDFLEVEQDIEGRITCKFLDTRWRTKEETIAHIKEAIEGYVGALKEDNLPIPPENFEAFVVAV